MQIQAFQSGQGLQGNSNLLSVGQVQHVSIKERTSATTAVVSLKGKDINMTFENGVPSQNKTLVEITAIEHDQITGKFISLSQPEAEVQNPTKLDEIWKATGGDSSNKGMRQAAQILQEKGYPFSKEDLQVIARFLKAESGTVEQKLASLTALTNRRLEVRLPELTAIHTALHGGSFGELVSEIGKEIPEISKVSTPSFPLSSTTIRDVKAVIQTETDFSKITKQVLKVIEDSVNLPSIEKNAILKALQAGKEPLIQTLSVMEQKESLVNPNKLNVSVQGKEILDFMKSIQRDASMTVVLEKGSAFLKSESSHGLEGIERFRAVVDQATDFSFKGRELAARKELMAALFNLQEDNPHLVEVQQTTALSESEQSIINQVMQGLSFPSKNVIVTEISQKLSQMTIDFKQIKREITRNLEQSIKLIEQQQPRVKQVLESTIKQLDQAILKGDFILYADMSTEKKLLQASSRLQEARALLLNGKQLEASQIVKEVKASVDTLLFKPSDVKVKHFVGGMTEDAFAQSAKPEQSGRSVLELVRKLGMMNEHDVAKSLLSGKQQELSPTLKSSLLSLLQADRQNPKLTQQVEQAVQHLTGQQLLAKADSSGMQSLALQLPLLLHKEVENVKVYVNSQSDKEQLDWENCSLYFVLETKRLGEIGLLLTVTNRNLFLTFKSDKDELRQSVSGLTESSLKQFEEIGYKVGSVQFKPMTVDMKESEQITHPSAQAVFKKKGYDMTI